MRSLFVRIFVSFWVAQALFIVLAMLLTLAMRPGRVAAAIEAAEPKLLNESFAAYLSGGPDGFRKFAWNQHDAQRIHLFLFDEQGQEVSGRTPPDWVLKVNRGQASTADTIWGRLRPMQFLKQASVMPDGRRYSLVIELPPPKHSLFGPNGEPFLAIGIGIISSGFICFLLAHYLTAPIVRLRAATQKLASGDLKARAGKPNARGRDDISQLVRDFDRMAERIENLLDSQARLLKDISHELRSPLARLNVALELARQRSGPEAQTSLDRMEREASRLNELIGRLLTIARLDAGNQVIQRVPVQLSELVADVANDAAFEAQSRGCHVDYAILADAEVLGDQSLLHSAVENIVRNAIRYTQEGTSVQVRLERRPAKNGVSEEAVVQVVDAGSGVPEDSLQKIFQPFYRIDDARGRGTGGAGLGLAIADRAVRLHGGRATAANLPRGGLCVELLLPVLPLRQPTRSSERIQIIENISAG